MRPVSQRTWLLGVLGLFTVFLIQVRPVDDVDVFWQVRLGELTLDQGRLITHDPFTYTHHGEPVPTVGWLAQVLFAVLYRLGWWYAVQFVHAVVFAAAFVVLAMTVRVEDAGPFSLALAVLAGIVTAIPHSSVRPQSLGLLGFAVLLAMARSTMRPAVQFLVVIPVLVVWQNAHPSVGIGFVALLPLVVAEWVRYYRKMVRHKPIALTGLLVLAGASQFATPMGPAILATARANEKIARDLLAVSEWLPPWDPSVRDATVVFWVLLFVTLVLLVRLRFRVDAGDLGLFLVLTALSFYAARFILFWAVALVPVWARWIERAKPASLFAGHGERPISRAALVATLVVGPCLAFGLPPLVRPILSPKLPTEGVRQLQARLPAGRIYNYREWGGPLILPDDPPWQVAIDGRLYLFPVSDWEDYEAVARGEVSVEQVVGQHDPDAFFLRPSYHRAFIALLGRSRAWEEVYADETCSVWMRRAEESRARRNPT